MSVRFLAALACLGLVFSAHAQRVTPSTRASGLATSSGAHTTSVTTQTAAFALIELCYFNDTGPDATVRPTSVTLDGQAATLIDSAWVTNSFDIALYKVSGFTAGTKNLGYTLSATGTYFSMDAAIEYYNGTPTYGAHGAAATAGGPPVAASTSSLANTNGDLILSAYCVHRDSGAGSPTMGSGQSKQDETDDGASSFYGFTTETGTGAGDVQSATGRAPAIASTVITIASGAFDATPSVSAHTTTAYTVVGSLSGAGTVKAVACYGGSTAPSIAEINAAHCAGGSTPAASATQSPGGAPFDFSLTLTPSQSPAFPLYDLYVTDGTTRTSIVNSFLTAPSTCGAGSNQPCQFVQLTSVAVGGIASIATLAYDAQTTNFVVGDTVTGGTSGAVGQIMSDTDAGATGTLTLWISSGTFVDNEALTGAIYGAATVNGTASYLYAVNDVLVAPTYVMPGGTGILLSIGTDGNAIYFSGAERETAINIKVYDYSALGYASGDIDFVNNDTAASCSALGVLSLVINIAMTAFDLDDICSSIYGDALTSSIVSGTLPTGLSLNGSTNATTGTPTVANSGVTIRYVVADSYNALSYADVTYEVLSSYHSPDCMSSVTALDFCEALYSDASANTAVFVATGVCSNSVAAADVISTSPTKNAQVQIGANVGITFSVGTCSTKKMVNCLSKTAAACQTLLTAAYAAAFNLVQTTASCPAAYTSGIIFAQSPGPGAKVGLTGTLTVNVCP